MFRFVAPLADFCLVPMGVEVSVSKYIAECQRVLEKSGLKYEASPKLVGHGVYSRPSRG